MPPALTPEQRLAIADRHGAGEPLASIANDMGIHYETARKWWRIARIEGRKCIAHRPRKTVGILHNTPPEILALIDKLRREHPTWGVPYLREQVLADPGLSGPLKAKVPALSSFYRYLRLVEERPPQRPLRQHVPCAPLIRQAEAPHHLWQMDLKEKCTVQGLHQQVSVVNVRDVHSSVTIGALVFELKRKWSTLRGAQMQQTLRQCFASWGLPDILRTDKGSCFLGNAAQTGFPSMFTLWLVGLGIRHETITKGQVTQNGCVERFNRTYSSLVLRDGPFDSLGALQALSDTVVDFLNTTYPSQAGTCQGRAPLQAHPEALTPRRNYEPAQEPKLFSIERVSKYLAQFVWQRRADSVGKVSIADRSYCLGREHKGRVFDVHFDPADRHFVFTTPDGTITLRRQALGLEADDILNLRTRSTA